jgi:NAD(P)-dependent dehydrogenase (short-subunit alcohol dehydrogenase family)
VGEQNKGGTFVQALYFQFYVERGSLVSIGTFSGLSSFTSVVAHVIQVVALETAGSGVTANAICPGWVLTPLGSICNCL